jgi:hypothetical protein
LSVVIMMRGMAAKWTIASMGFGSRSSANSTGAVLDASALNTWPASVMSAISVRTVRFGIGTRSRFITS